MPNKTIVGIDIGSRFTKSAVFTHGQLHNLYKLSTIEFYKILATQQELHLLPPGLEDITGKNSLYVSTGYGRNRLSFVDAIILPEIHAHVYGVNHLLSIRDYTLLDIGGQDTKVVKVRKGQITDFCMSDKCASCSGKFFENMAHALSVDLSWLFRWKDNPVNLNSTCAVFAETEVTGYLSEGISMERLCAAINYSVFRKVYPLLRQAFSPIIVMTGGVATNSAIQAFIENELGVRVVIPPHTFETGAIGCAVYALSKSM